MRFNSHNQPLCEQCEQPNGRLHVVDENGTGLDRDDWPSYVLICYKCISDIGAWAPKEWQSAMDNQQRLLWTRTGGQIYFSNGKTENELR